MHPQHRLLLILILTCLPIMSLQTISAVKTPNTIPPPPATSIKGSEPSQEPDIPDEEPGISEIQEFLRLVGPEVNKNVHEISSDVFNLLITFLPAALIFEMADIQNGILYERLFEFEDINQGISPQFGQLIEIYEIFTPPILFRSQFLSRELTAEEIDAVQNEKIAKRLKSYKFGTKIQNEDYVYSINQGGILEIESKGQTSLIKLDEVRPLTEIEILRLRLNVFRNQFYIETEWLSAAYNSLEQQFKALQFRNESLQLLANRLTRLQESFKNFELPQQLLIDTDAEYFNYFNIFKNRISYIEGGSWTQFLMRIAIPFDRQFSYAVTIRKSVSSEIILGIADRSLALSDKDSCEKDFAICYQGSNGMKYPELEIQNSGFRAGETVVIIVSLEQGTVEWRVGAQVRAISYHQILKQNSRTFVPLIGMKDKYDNIEWLGVS